MEFNQRTIVKLLLFLGFLTTIFFKPAYAYDFSAGVFQFQQKLATKGDPQAQYKLGFMYENGQGVKTDLDQALKWYKKSAAQNYAPAKMRITYVDIRKNGYQSAKHSSWLKKLKKDAEANDGESLLLLGSLYKTGFILKKDYKKAANLFKRAVNKNIPGAETELEATNAALVAQQNRQRAKEMRERKKKQDAEKRKKEELISKKQSEAERKRQQAIQRAERERIAAEKARLALENERLRLLEQKRRLEEKQQALRLKQTQKEQESTPDSATEQKEKPKNFDKSICKGKKARFLTICR